MPTASWKKIPNTENSSVQLRNQFFSKQWDYGGGGGQGVRNCFRKQYKPWQPVERHHESYWRE